MLLCEGILEINATDPPIPRQLCDKCGSHANYGLHGGLGWVFGFKGMITLRQRWTLSSALCLVLILWSTSGRGMKSHNLASAHGSLADCLDTEPSPLLAETAPYEGRRGSCMNILASNRAASELCQNCQIKVLCSGTPKLAPCEVRV